MNSWVIYIFLICFKLVMDFYNFQSVLEFYYTCVPWGHMPIIADAVYCLLIFSHSWLRLLCTWKLKILILSNTFLFEHKLWECHRLNGLNELIILTSLTSIYSLCVLNKLSHFYVTLKHDHTFHNILPISLKLFDGFKFLIKMSYCFDYRNRQKIDFRQLTTADKN